MFWIFVRIAPISKISILWGNRKKTRPFLHISLLIEYSVNSKSILMSTSFGTNTVIVSRVHCITIYYRTSTRKVNLEDPPCSLESDPSLRCLSASVL